MRKPSLKVFLCKIVVSAGLPDRPAFPSQERIDRFRDLRAQNAHLAPYGPKPPGKRPPPNLAALPKPHSREGHALCHERRKPVIEFAKQRKAAELKAERERILYGTKPTLQQRLAAIPPPTYTSIASKPVLLNFEKLTVADLVRIFTPKFEATLRRLDVFKSFQIEEKIPADHIADLHALIERLTHLKGCLKDTGAVRIKDEFQGWNFGLKQIGDISFQGLRRNQAQIIKALSAVWRSNYFEYE